MTETSRFVIYIKNIIVLVKKNKYLIPPLSFTLNAPFLALKNSTIDPEATQTDTITIDKLKAPEVNFFGEKWEGI